MTDTTIQTTRPATAMTDEARLGWALAVLVAAVTAATSVWGLPALALSALAMVPVIWVLLLLITVGK